MPHLPWFDPESYRGNAAVFWTLMRERRAKGWLNASFHAELRELLLHAAIRESLLCPAYVLMPDHAHLVWIGCRKASDQRNAMRFLRTHVTCELTERSPKGAAFELQKQSPDPVLRHRERARGALARACFHVLDNPRRARLVATAKDWPHLGAVVPGHPCLHPLEDGFWPTFWQLYQNHRES